MRVADLMETNVEVADCGMPAEDAWRFMRDRDLALLVVTRDQDIVGVVTRHQLDGPHGRENREDRTLNAFLRGSGLTLTPECSTQHAADLLDGSTCGCVPVLDRGHIVGVVTTAGLLRRISTPAARPA